MSSYNTPDAFSTELAPQVAGHRGQAQGEAPVTAESDALHADTAVSLLMERLENGSIINVPSNQFAHNPEVIPILEAFQKGDKPS